jgi:hypothetical protein
MLFLYQCQYRYYAVPKMRSDKTETRHINYNRVIWFSRYLETLKIEKK